jgi:hypothetical protein
MGVLEGLWLSWCVERTLPEIQSALLSFNAGVYLFNINVIISYPLGIVNKKILFQLLHFKAGNTDVFLVV